MTLKGLGHCKDVKICQGRLVTFDYHVGKLYTPNYIQ